MTIVIRLKPEASRIEAIARGGFEAPLLMLLPKGGLKGHEVTRYGRFLRWPFDAPVA